LCNNNNRQQLLEEIKAQERCVLLKQMAVMQTKQEHTIDQQADLLQALKLFAVGFEVAGSMRRRHTEPNEEDEEDKEEEAAAAAFTRRGGGGGGRTSRGCCNDAFDI
jgi:hypothetical protein